MKILVFRIGSLGDTVMALPALEWIREHYGAACRIMLLEDKALGSEVAIRHLLQGTFYADGFFAYPSGRRNLRFVFSLIDLIWKIRRERFDAVINLAPGQRTRVALVRDRLFFLLCRIPSFIGFHSFSTDVSYPRQVDGRPAPVPSEASFLLERLTASGLPTGRRMDDPVPRPALRLTATELQQAETWLEVRRRHPDRPLVAMAPGVKQPVNQWPVENYAAVGRELVRGGKWELIVIGGMKEIPLQEQLLHTWKEGIGAAGAFSPRMTAALLSHCRLFIGPDSGPMHLAAAVGVPCVAIFSDRDNPGRWHPLGSGHRVIRKSVPCGGCGHSVCPRPDHLCMRSVTVDEVVTVALQQLSANDQGAVSTTAEGLTRQTGVWPLTPFLPDLSTRDDGAGSQGLV
ncbi:MAG: glycosyltransferase family 9 protein [Magnetococcales bacterium]|nr:glycosyltransferase family 9 protein [Magnetococcales bacterium]